MKKQLSDEQFDILMKTLIADASLDDEAVDEIADSPTLWWSVQRQINVQRAAAAPWPPAWRRWLMAGVPVLAALALVSIFVFRPSGGNTEQAGVQQNVTTAAVKSPPPDVTEPALPADESYTPAVSTSNDERPVTQRVRAIRPAAARKAAEPTPIRSVEKRAEIKSDFIALTYARTPDSGQVVRVKVPSSMMVTLGLVASVEKPTDLVDAEVVVGDDGMTHAIRFIR